MKKFNNLKENSMYRCKYFKIEELIDKETFEARGEKAWELLDDRALKALDLLREGLGKPLTLNNWLGGGTMDECGLRNPLTSTGSKYSQHKFGRGFDVHSKDFTAEQMRDYVRKNYKVLGITCIEKDTSWLHFDCRNCTPLLEVPFK
jgi:hypothetical protein